jgi:hypothetical protein
MKRGGIVRVLLRSLDNRRAVPQTYREPNTMSWSDFLSRVDLLALMIPIVAIVVGGIVAIVVALIRHRERMAMIERGLYPPDDPPEEDDPEDEPTARPGAFDQTGAYAGKAVPRSP